MSVYETKTISPLKLDLDLKNPRFILPVENPTERDIILHLLKNENVDEFCKQLNAMGTILPGERIVVCLEDEKYVVLEGNRRVCCCKMLLNPTLIPKEYVNKIPTITQQAKINLSKINVDIVESREIAKKYLAARHINGVKRWELIAKMNYVTEAFSSGASVSEIEDTTSLTTSLIKKYLRESKLLQLGIDNGKWNEKEKNSLSLDKIEPIKYLYHFGRGLVRYLGIHYDQKFIPHSNLISDKTLYKIFATLISKATPYNSKHADAVAH